MIRWINSLSGRLVLAVLLALLMAQAIGILLFVDSNERDRSEMVSEGFMREVSGQVQLFNETTVDRRAYLRFKRQPGLTFWLSPSPAVEASMSELPADAPRLPRDWDAIGTANKRIVWFPDRRPMTERYAIAPLPVERNLGPDITRPNATARQSANILEDHYSIAPMFDRPRDRPPPGGPRPGGERGAGLPRGDGARPPPPPPPDEAGPVRGRPTSLPLLERPTVRWRVSVQLDDGEWLNAEHLYELGLPPWLKTVLLQNAVILAAMLLLVVPAVGFATRRLAQVARAADKVGRGEDTDPLPESGVFEVRQLTQAFNAMSLRLRRFVQGRTQMLAGISHDLRTPITALRLRADMVDDEENRERMLALIADMQHLTESTLTLARDDSFTEKTEMVDLSALVEAECDDLSDAGLDVAAEVDRGITFACRPRSLRRAIRNLAENAAKYGKRARIGIEDHARHVAITIDDNGPGIPEADMERAFQPFVRLEASRSRETGGSGLGLAIARSIVRNHGGDIVLTNRPEGGLRATVSLPKPDDVR